MFFEYAPDAAVLDALAGGQLAGRMLRAVRLWWILRLLYGDGNHGSAPGNLFNAPRLMKCLYAPGHDWGERRTSDGTSCPGCLCTLSLEALLHRFDADLPVETWCLEVSRRTGLAPELLRRYLKKRPFAIVARSLRDDLQHLCRLGWLQRDGASGLYRRRLVEEFPRLLPEEQSAVPAVYRRSVAQALQTVQFAYPQLYALVNEWQGDDDTDRRIFVEFDYILSEEDAERVDDYQEQLRGWWEAGDLRPVTFAYTLSTDRKVQICVYPVCLHYVRRAKYLSAYGLGPEGHIGWHNYRLDRIASTTLKPLDWADPQVPVALHSCRQDGNLPTPAYVRKALNEAWGFNFYLPAALLLLRFPADYAARWLANTHRHPTFGPIPYAQLPSLIRRHYSDSREQQPMLALVARRPTSDAYYKALVRLGDTNLTLRLREWRPHGEVLAPLALRRQMAEEVRLELHHYADL
ncbi:TIGR03985 family CRISPR-associated protein [Gloeobacter kilaueensis]|uniref:WYL domain-containing protein n=1 Tax=Gloeobacter kilaueensis (strain ATCC BAA-2537 / CCAP 1431/1 / ULC 316 / JS1) TaxID=1183438 RepID=U5QI79_GLOK1|nr:TIGR03985 family CRISPR-associated protein [Gloeobacter kilaueensis]AGY58598.1 hypothetical protein GKIL_2352 [Gloeobacter kilaueensis JS1]